MAPTMFRQANLDQAGPALAESARWRAAAVGGGGGGAT